MICCLFGHRDTPADVRPLLEKVLEGLIAERQVSLVMVGGQGAFDRMAAGLMRQLRERYPHVKFCEVLAYPPCRKRESQALESILPEGIENVPPKFAISWRNRWMIDRSDIVAVYMTHRYGGVGTAVEYARRRSKEIINTAQ